MGEDHDQLLEVCKSLRSKEKMAPSMKKEVQRIMRDF